MHDPILTHRQGKVAVVEINRADARNSLGPAHREALQAAFDAIAINPGVRAVVLTGAGESFCAGADLKAAGSATNTHPRSTLWSMLHVVQPLLETIGRMDKPVIAAVNGPAVGFGMSLALACDLIVMDEQAYLLSQFIRLGLVPDGGAVWFLAQRIGYGRMFETVADARRLDADTCQRWGIANRIAAPGQARADALAWAENLAAAAPTAMGLTKRLARMAMTNRLEESLMLEAEFQNMCRGSADTREAIAAFMEKRAPNFGE